MVHVLNASIALRLQSPWLRACRPFLCSTRLLCVARLSCLGLYHWLSRYHYFLFGHALSLGYGNLKLSAQKFSR